MTDEFESIFDPELLAEFTTESSESLADIENQLLQIEEAGANIDDDLVNTVFRGVHSIKGVAGFLGLTRINALSHALEDVLNRIRNRDLVPTPDIVNVMLKAADELRTMVGAPEQSNETDVTIHVAALKAIHETDSPPPAATEPDASPTQTSEPNSVPAPTDEQKPVAAATTPEPESPPATETKTSSPPADTKLRVSVATLDHLMNLAGEMVLNRNRLVRFSNRESNPELSTLASDIDQITCELQDVIMKTRMQPIANVFNRFPRIVRDLSSKLGKECKLLVEGKDVEVDKSIIEAIGDPLTHLIRNSVDHGIELPADRTSASKPGAGTIRLSAYHRTGQVCIDIEDDGGGIDPDKLRQKATSKGVITEAQAAAMGDREALSLIFHPGFSTAEKLTDVSGRGVGMDVVRTNIERIGGAVEVNSDLGRGTIIQITLPLTLAIIRSLIVGSQSRRFAIPQVNVTELVRISRTEAEDRIERINDAVIFRLRDTLIPLIELREVLDLEGPDETAAPSRAMNILVLETGRSRYGLIVEDLHDSEEIVVKPLGRDLQDCPSLAGATILGDGSIAFILDIPGIADKADLNGIEDNCPVDSKDGAPGQTSQQSLLVFRNSATDQFAIPLSLVSRIERVELNTFERYGTRTVMKYRGGTLPLIVLEDVIGVEPREGRKFGSVIVMDTLTGEFGLVAPKIQDIREVPVNIDNDSLRQQGILGSQVIDGITTRFLDVFALLALAYPDVAPPPETRAARSAQTILVAEDSLFFREHLTACLTDAGYNVLSAEDGVDAMNTLNSKHNIVDVVVTDIEMPNMSGTDLCREIRATEHFDYIPVIGMSALSGEDNIRSAFDCGFDEYLAKDSQKELLVAIHRLANAGHVSSGTPQLMEV